MAGIHFQPELIGYNGQGAFRFWCQKVLPLVYDDSLSYYELLCKVVKYLNNTNEDVKLLGNSYLKLVEFVNGYFDNLDVTSEVNNKLDEMVESGELDDVIASGVSAAAMQATEQQLPGVVAEQIDAVVAEQIDGSVAGQIDEAVDSAVSDKIDGVVESQIDGAVARQIDGVVNEQIGPAVLEQSGGLAAPAVTSWLEQNVVPQGSAVVVDESLSVQGAAADALYTGTGIKALENEFVWDNSSIEFEVGGISSTTGEGNSATHIRTVNFVENISEVKCNDGYVLEAYAYNKNTDAFVGGYRAGNFAVDESGQDTVIGLPNYYKYKIVLVFIGSPTRPTTVEDKSNVYFLIGTDTTLSLGNKAADAKAVGDALDELASRPGLTNEAKLALLNCFAHVAWIDENGQQYYNGLEAALMQKTLVSITAVFVQGNNEIYTHDSLDVLKEYLTVTANYDDNTSGIVTSYTLSGTLTAGTSTITVNYSDKTTTFNATVTAGVPDSYNVYDYLQMKSKTGEYNLLPKAQWIEMAQYSNLNAVSCEFAVLRLSGAASGGPAVFGRRSTSGALTSFGFYPKDTQLGYHLHGDEGTNPASFTTNVVNIVKYTNTDVSPSSLQVNDNTPVSIDWVDNTVLNLAPALFGNPINDENSNCNKWLQLGYVKFFDLSDNKIGHYFPVVRKLDNRIGIFDIAEQEFHTTSTSSYSTIGNSNCIYEVGMWG